jgi:hypothetical protein
VFARPEPDGRRRVRRPIKWLIRIGIGLVVLALVGLAGFTWFAYWPFEGRAARLEALVPGEVDFVWRGSWKEIEESGAVRRWLFDDPPIPSLSADRMKVGDQTLAKALERVPEIEAQVTDGIPAGLKPFQGFLFGTRDFRVVRDLLAGDVLGAGRWCGVGNPRERPPQWRELILLTRVTPQVKFAFESLRHGFVRKGVAEGPAARDVRIEMRSDGLLQVELLNVVPPKRPETCDGGKPMGSLNVWYVGRVKDVIAVSNSEDLIGRFADLGRGQGESVLDWKDDFRMPKAEGGLSGAADLTDLRAYLNRALSIGGEPDRLTTVLSKFLAVDALDRLTGRVQPLPGRDGLLATAQVRYNPDRLRDFRDVAATYDLLPERVATSIARLVPEKDTAAVAVVRTPPRVLLQTIFESLDGLEQQTIEENLRALSAERRKRNEPAYESVAQFLDEFAAQLGSTTGVAVARIPAVFDAAKYEEYYPVGEPVPIAAYAVMVKIREGASQEQVNQWLSDRIAALGFDPPELVTSPDGKLTYSRLKIRPRVGRDGTAALPPEYENVRPAFKVAQGHVLLSTREDYLLEILKTMRGGPDDPRAVGATPAFDAAMRELPPDATLALYLHAANLRALLWDHRNDAVRKAHPDNEYAREYRVRLIRGAGSRPDHGKISQQVDEEMTRWRREEYPRFVEEYRQGLDAWRRVASAAFVLAADRNESRVSVGAAVVFAAPGGGAP